MKKTNVMDVKVNGEPLFSPTVWDKREPLFSPTVWDKKGPLFNEKAFEKKELFSK
ncbi:MAG: hypothetical protein ACRCWN_06280 [Fusobacteriaceae bacterium]